MSDNPIIKYTAKDSVFVDLFSIPRYLLELYQSLHPEDQLTTLQDLKTITLKSIIAEHPYNDLGFRVNHRYMILVEAQSTWTPNILIRAWNYLAQTYVDYFHEMNVSLYDNVNIQLPVPELYVIYTGSKNISNEVSFNKTFFNGDSPIDLGIVHKLSIQLRRNSIIPIRMEIIADNIEGSKLIVRNSDAFRVLV